MKIQIFRTIAAAAGLCLAGSANAAVQAGTPAATVIAIPPLTSPDAGAKGNEMLSMAWQATQLIATDLRQTAELMPLNPDRKDYYSYPEVTAPTFSKWRDKGAKALLTGFVQSRSDGRLTVGCYIYDVEKGRELGRKGFVVAPSDWRRAAHKCSGLAYEGVTGAPGPFDSRIAYVAESGSGNARVHRIAVMDSDGFNHRYVTPGGTIVLTPHLSPKAELLAYVSFDAGTPQVRILDLATKNQHPLVPNGAMSFAPRFSPDGSKIAFSMMLGPNADIYVAGPNGGLARRLTTSPGTDTDASFSPDGSKIIFESDRSGSQQLYVMDAHGANEHRISFGGGWYASPEWSPDGEWIVFTRRGAGARQIGIIKPDGSGERVLTTGPADDSPSWAASSREILFQRNDAAGRPGLYRLTLDGSDPRKMTTPQDGSDPDWSPTID